MSFTVVYGILLKEKIAILMVAVMMGDELVGWPGFRMQPFVSMEDKTSMLDLLESENSPFPKSEFSAKSVITTFDQAIELNQEIVIPKENYEKLLAAYVNDHAITRLLKRLQRDGKL